MSKNILSDTDYTKGWDNRFGVSVVVGKVSKIEASEKGANVRVIMADRVDHEGNPLISKPVPIMQIASKSKKSFAMPRLNDNVLMVKLPNGTSNYMVIGSLYTKNDPPPVTDPKVDYCEWEGGHTEKFDANDSADPFLTQDFKAGWKGTYKKDVNLNTTDGAKFNVVADGDVLVKSATGNVNVESPTGTVTIKQQTIDLQATTIKLTGHVIVTGNIDEAGVHLDNRGHHTNTAVLQERLNKLETLLAAVETRLAQLEARHGD
jgi:Phage-related baseplate assembly protein.